MQEAPLHSLGSEIRGSVAPEAGTTYELWSVPSFSEQRPEILDGRDIGSSKRPVMPGDVLICKINPRINRVWIVSDPSGPFVQVASPEFLVFRPNNPAIARYLMWYLRSPIFRDWIKLSAEGATGSHTRAKSAPILQQPIPIAPAAEYTAIVNTIESHFSHLDAAGASLIRASLALQALQEQRYRAVLSSDAPLVRLSEIARTSSGGTPSRRDASNFGGEIPWIKSGELGDGTVTGTEESITCAGLRSSSAKIFNKGTLLMAMYGATIGRLGIVGMSSAATNQAVCAIEPHDRELTPYLWLCLRALRSDIVAAGKGGAQPNISQGVIQSLSIPLPSPSRRAALVAILERDIDELVRIRGIVDLQASRLTALRRAVLLGAFARRKMEVA